jgi:hypothetical protein
MGGVFSSPSPAPPPPPPPVQPAPVVYPSKPVQAGEREAEERKAMKRVRTGMGTQARQPSILGAAGTTDTKTLLGQ